MPGSNNKWRKAAIIIILWLLFLLIDLLKKTSLDYSSPFFLYSYLPGFVIWILITFPMMSIFNWSGKYPLFKRLLLLFGLGIMTGAAKVYINRLLYHSFWFAFDPASARQAFKQLLTTFGSSFYYMEAIIIAWVLLIVFYLFEVTNKYKSKSLEAAKLETELATANLQALKMQIHPHFLFNAHNAIATLLRAQQTEQALEMLLRLSDLLRASLSNFKDQFVPLKEEIAFIDNYLEIEKIRFEDTLEVVQEIDQALLNARVPVFVLQPLVENAIKHGVSKNMGASTIKLEAFKDNGNLHFLVFNTGDYVEPHLSQLNGGIGLSNLKKRLFTLFDDRATLSISEEQEGVVAKIIIPYQEKAVGNDQVISSKQ